MPKTQRQRTAAATAYHYDTTDNVHKPCTINYSRLTRLKLELTQWMCIKKALSADV